MKTFNEVVEEEKARFIGTWLPNGKEPEQPQMEADFDQAVHKAALAVVEEIAKAINEDTEFCKVSCRPISVATLTAITTLRKQLTNR